MQAAEQLGGSWRLPTLAELETLVCDKCEKPKVNEKYFPNISPEAYWTQTQNKLNKKMYRGAMQCILSELIRQERLIVVHEFAVESHKTKDLVTKLKDFDLDNVLIVSDQIEENLYLAARNLHKVDVLDVSGLDPVSLIGFEKVLITVPALKKAEELLS